MDVSTLILSCLTVGSAIFLAWIVSNFQLVRRNRIPNSTSLVPISFVNEMFKILMPLFVISVVFGLRENVGVDYESYKMIYEEQITADVFDSLSSSDVEWLFTIICSLLRSLEMPYYVMFVVMMIISMGSYLCFIKHYNSQIFLATYMLFATGVFFWNLNIMRQGISFFILLHAYKYISSQKFIRFLLVVVIASGFHVSALLSIPLYLFAYLKKTLLPTFGAILMYFVCWIFREEILRVFWGLLNFSYLSDTKYAYYADVIETWEMGIGSGLGLLSLKMIDLFLIIGMPFVIKNNKKIRLEVYYNIFYIGALISCISGVNMLLFRLPFCLISIRFLLAGFLCWFVLNNWKNISSYLRVVGVGCLLLSTANLVGGIIALKFKFI